MKDINGANFGLVIAFLLPGFLCLWGLSFSFESLDTIVSGIRSTGEAQFGDFLYSALASLSVGLLLSAIRWAIIDHIMPCTGAYPPTLDLEKLRVTDTREAFDRIVENHYRYYQYYSNSLVALIIGLVTYIFAKGPPPYIVSGSLVAVGLALFLGSRDALKKYCAAADKILC